MADDKAANGKKKIAIYLSVGIAVLLGLVLIGVEVWSHSHKPKNYSHI